MKKILIPNGNFKKNLKTIFSISLFDIEYDNILFNDIMLFLKNQFVRNLKNCEILFK